MQYPVLGTAEGALRLSPRQGGGEKRESRAERGKWRNGEGRVARREKGRKGKEAKSVDLD